MAARRRGSRRSIGGPGRSTWAPAASSSAKQLVKRESNVAHAGDRFGLLSRLAHAHQQSQPAVRTPQAVVAADMLHMQAGEAFARPMAAEVAIAEA
jgi:hypothetical protein